MSWIAVAAAALVAGSGAEREARAYEIGLDLASVMETQGRWNTPRNASIALATAYYESDRFAADVDLGPCEGSRCDNGRSACVMQIYTRNGVTRTGHTIEDLFADRELCFSEGIRILRGSLWACRHLPHGHRLSAYIWGRCKESERSLHRMRLAERILWAYGPKRTY